MYNKFFKINLKIIPLVLAALVNVNAQSYTVTGNISTSTGIVKYASVTFINEDNTSKKFTSITDSLGNYRLDIITSVRGSGNLPTSFELAQNYPNPFSSSTSITYKLNKQSDISVKIYNILGQTVKEYSVGIQNIGVHGIVWDGTNNFGYRVTPGVYFYQLNTGTERSIKKMVYGFGNSNAGQVLVYRNESFNKKEEDVKSTLLVSGNYTVKIENTDNTRPPIETKQINNISIRKDTTMNFTVTETNDFSLCYQKAAENNIEIFLNNIKGTHPKNISNYGWENHSQTWSPDGNYIAFQQLGTPTYVCLYDTKKDTVIYLTAGPDGYGAGVPLWTPDSKHIIYSGHWNTYMINPDGSNNRKLQHSPEFFYSNSYNFLYRISYDSIYVSNIDGTYNEFVLNTKTIGKNYVTPTDFDPYNHKILILADPTPQITDLLVTYNVDSKKLDTIAVADTGWLYSHPKFSSDYSKVATLKINYGERIQKICILENGTETDLVTINNFQNEMFSFYPLAFSPDDKYLAYSKMIVLENGGMLFYLYIIELETKRITFIDMGFGAIWNPQKEH